MSPVAWMLAGGGVVATIVALVRFLLARVRNEAHEQGRVVGAIEQRQESSRRIADVLTRKRELSRDERERRDIRDRDLKRIDVETVQDLQAAPPATPEAAELEGEADRREALDEAAHDDAFGDGDTTISDAVRDEDLEDTAPDQEPAK